MLVGILEMQNGLRSGEKALYDLLRRDVFEGDRQTKETKLVCAGHSQLCKRLGISRPSLRNHLAGLLEKGVIEIKAVEYPPLQKPRIYSVRSYKEVLLLWRQTGATKALRTQGGAVALANEKGEHVYVKAPVHQVRTETPPAAIAALKAKIQSEIPDLVGKVHSALDELRPCDLGAARRVINALTDARPGITPAEILTITIDEAARIRGKKDIHDPVALVISTAPMIASSPSFEGIRRTVAEKIRRDAEQRTAATIATRYPMGSPDECATRLWIAEATLIAWEAEAHPPDQIQHKQKLDRDVIRGRADLDQANAIAIQCGDSQAEPNDHAELLRRIEAKRKRHEAAKIAAAEAQAKQESESKWRAERGFAPLPQSLSA